MIGQIGPWGKLRYVISGEDKRHKSGYIARSRVLDKVGVAAHFK